MQPPLLRDLRAQGGGLGVVDGALEPARQPRALLVVGGGDAVHLGHELLRDTLHLLLFPLLERGARAGAAVAAALERRETSEQRLAQRVELVPLELRAAGHAHLLLDAGDVVRRRAQHRFDFGKFGRVGAAPLLEGGGAAARLVLQRGQLRLEFGHRRRQLRLREPTRGGVGAGGGEGGALLGGLLERGLECGVLGLEGRDGLGRRRAVGRSVA